MFRALKDNWSLFTGIALLMVSNGLLTTLLTFRGVALGFSEVTIGVMQAGYPLGALVGCVIAPKLVQKVGHIRAFGALASLCSVSAIVHLVTADPVSWGVMRILAGFCYPGLYVVAESWLNAKAENSNRARILSIYFVVHALGSSAGAALAGYDEQSGAILFGIASILISLSLVPILTSDNKAPDYIAPERLAFATLLKISPMAVLGAALNGVFVASIFIAMPLYGLAIGLGSGQAAKLLVAATLAGAIFQFPLGWLSDRLDRRIVVFGASIAASGVSLALMAGLFDGHVHLAVGIMAGLVLPIYSLCAAHANDQLKPSQIVPASGTLALTLNTGILAGAASGPFVLAGFGPSGLLIYLAVISGLTAVVAATRVGQVVAPEGTHSVQAVALQGVQTTGELYHEAVRQKQE